MNKVAIGIFITLCTLLVSYNANAAELLQDEYIDEYAKQVEINRPETNLKYNYNSTNRMKIKLKLVGPPVSTKKMNLYDGQPLDFAVKQNVKYNGKVYIKQGTRATGEVQTYMPRGMNGIPAMIAFDNFQIQGLDKNKLHGFYTKKGHSRTLLLLPIKWALTLLWPSGYFVNFVKGGNATFDDRDVVYLYYYPNWNENL